MDSSELKKGVQALQWEANYRLKAEDASAKHFLALTGALDPDFEKYVDECKVHVGKALDIGTGLGEQAVFLAKKGFVTTATDVSDTALEKAKKFAEDEQASVTFLNDNILQSAIDEQYDLVIDRGCFTILPVEYADDYIKAVKKIIKPGGWLFLKADKKRAGEVSKISEDSALIVHALTESSYRAMTQKTIPAVVLIAKRVS